MDSLERLQGLHADLVAFNDARLANVDRLLHELEDSISEFRSLLDKNELTNNDRELWRNNKVEVNGQEYGFDATFRELSFAVAKTLDVDEEEAGKLIIQSQSSDQEADEQLIIANVVSNYHHRRDVLLQNLRLTLQYSVNLDRPEPERRRFEEIVHQVVDIKQGPMSNATDFFRKCLAAMQKVEGNIFSVIRDIQSKELLSHVRTKAFYATLEFQRDMLFKQHEALGAIIAYLFRAYLATSEDLRKMLELSKNWQRLDMLWTHYLPAFSAAFRHFASPDGNVGMQEAIALDKLFSSASDTANPACRPLRAAIEMWWTAEHSAVWRDNAAKDPQLEKRTDAMRRSLNDGGLEFMLSACGTIKLDALRQPARHELVAMMLEGSTAVLESVGQTSSYFSLLLMEAYESFAEAWITNMPDSIRKLKSDEDDQRLAQITASEQTHLQISPRDQGIRLHLEAFLVLIAFAFEDRPEAAEQFWEDPDSNLYGFLQWASRRQTVPRVGAFCEMLCAISGSSEGAEAAHKFLLDDTAAVPNVKGRKLPSMNYGSIFFELEFYAKKVHERQPVSQVAKVRTVAQPEFNEMESPVMLSSYLRLLSHLSRRSSVVREFVLDDTNVDLPRGLLMLSSGPVPAYLRATVFTFLDAVLVDKPLAVADRIWSTIDEWASTSHDKALNTNQQQPTQATSSTLQATLNSLASSLDQADAFVQLLCGLTAPLPDASGQPIPFPTELGAAYRTPGIAPYVDFVCSQLTTKHVREWTEDTNSNGYLRCLHCVNFMATALEGFNESIATRSNNSAPAAGAAEYGLFYNQRHPFGRVMQWIFSTDLNQALMNLLHHPFEFVADALPDDPLLLVLRRCLDLIGATLDLQPTYFDVVKPKLKPIDGLKHINNAGLVAIEEVVIARPELILDLCLYSASRHPQVSIQSLALLRRLAISPRLQYEGLAEGQNRKKSSQMIDMLGPAGELQIKPVSGTLAEVCGIDVRELEAGAECDGYVLKEAILSFVNASLTTQSARPQLVHLLLGFSRVGQRLGLSDQMENAVSLLDAIVEIASGYPDGQDGVLLSWLIHLKATAAGVLRQLCTSPMSAELTLTQLRRLHYFSSQFSSQSLVSQTTLWDTLAILEPNFWLATSAEAFTEFLSFRASLYDYVSKELRYAFANNILSLQQQHLASLQGRSTDAGGATINHVTVYDLFDFAELDITTSLDFTELSYFRDFDLETYRLQPRPNMPKLYNTDDLSFTLLQSSDQIRQEAIQAGKPIEDNDPQEEAYYILNVLEARNKYVLAQVARTEALRSYVNMICTILECCHMEDATKTQFALQMLQLILPKLDTYMADGAPETLELTRAADALLLALSSIATPTTQNRVDTNIAERLFQLFRICTEGVASSTSTPGLRLILYSICAQYLARILPINASSDKDVNEKARRNAMDCIRSAGAQFITTLADDAEEGLDSCRLNALHFIAQLVSLARSERSNIILEQLVKANTLEVLLEPVRDIAAEFQTTEPQNRSHLLTVFEARSMLLLQVSRTRAGAAALLDAGLIQTLRDSMIFTADPDLGLDLSDTSTTDNSLALSRGPRASSYPSTTVTASAKSALHNYFVLLSHLLRVLLSTFLSFGTQNEKIVYMLRLFLQEYRANMVGVFKKHAGVNGFVTNAETRKLLEECVRCYTGLCVGAGFVEDEDEQGLDVGGTGERTGYMGSTERRNGGFT